MSNILLRSLLFVPGHNQRLMESAAKSAADVLLLDVEDSVQPKENKQLARDTIKDFVLENKLGGKQVFPRINDRESGEILKDVSQLTIAGVSGFIYPKAKKGEDVYFFCKLLEATEYEKGLPIGTFKIIPLIETAAAVLNVQEICTASRRVIAVAYGSEDFITDLEGIHDKDHLSLFTPRSIIAMGARASGVIPIDTVHVNVHDLEDLEMNLRLSKKLGFEGMLILHPKEISLAHTYYSPSEREVEDAKEILRLAAEAESEGKGVAIKNSKFIGPPMIKAAEKVLTKHKLILNHAKL